MCEMFYATRIAGTRANRRDAMNEEELQQIRDDARCDAAVQTLKDVLWRFEDTGEGSYNLYTVLGYLFEDLVREGCCGACLSETLAAVLTELGVDPSEHRDDGNAVLH